MNRAFTIAALLMAMGCSAQAKKQATPAPAIPEGKIFNLDKQDEKATSNKAIYKGDTLTVYVTSTGRLFVKLKSAKTGKEYRRYIKSPKQ